MISMSEAVGSMIKGASKMSAASGAFKELGNLLAHEKGAVGLGNVPHIGNLENSVARLYGGQTGVGGLPIQQLGKEMLDTRTLTPYLKPGEQSFHTYDEFNFGPNPSVQMPTGMSGIRAGTPGPLMQEAVAGAKPTRTAAEIAAERGRAAERGPKPSAAPTGTPEAAPTGTPEASPTGAPAPSVPGGTPTPEDPATASAWRDALANHWKPAAAIGGTALGAGALGHHTGYNSGAQDIGPGAWRQGLQAGQQAAQSARADSGWLSRMFGDAGQGVAQQALSQLAGPQMTQAVINQLLSRQ